MFFGGFFFIKIPTNACSNLDVTASVVAVQLVWFKWLVFGGLSAMTVVFVTGLQVQLGLQQHHGALATHDRQHPQQRSPQRAQQHRAHPNLDQTL